MPTLSARLDRIAAEVAATIGSGTQISPFTMRPEGLTIDDAYVVTSIVNQQRQAMGDAAMGRKIGFTNRILWEKYNVRAPIWGYMYRSTVHDTHASGSCKLAAFTEPLIEPEIVFGLAKTPETWMDEESLLACVDWIAQGFEIVQSIYPGWRFSAADTVAANGLHGALFIGSREPIGTKLIEWKQKLTDLPITLFCNGEPVAKGSSANVLDGPVSALSHLVRLLAQDPTNAPLRAGDIVTTGTLTDAMPINSGQTWSTSLGGLALNGIELHTE